MKYYLLLIYILILTFSVFSEEIEDKDYVIGKKDVIKYNVKINGIDMMILSGNQSSTLEAEVNSEGIAFFYMLDGVRCEYLTLTELEEKLERKYSKFYKNPEVDVTLSEKANFYIYLLGEVSSKGILYIYDKNDILSVLKPSYLLDSAKLDKIEVRRAGKTQYVNFDNLVNKGHMEENIFLNSGDVVFVPKAEEIYVYGEVNSPGKYYKQTNQYTLIKVLEQAGRWKPEALIRKLAIFRKDEKTGKQKRYTVNLERLTKNGDIRYDVDLKHGDIVYVPRNDRPDFTEFSSIVSGITGAYNSFKGWKE